MAQFDALDVIIPYDRGDLVAQFHQFGKIDLEEYRETGTHLRGYMPTNRSGLFKVLQQEGDKAKSSSLFLHTWPVS